MRDRPSLRVRQAQRRSSIKRCSIKGAPRLDSDPICDLPRAAVDVYKRPRHQIWRSELYRAWLKGWLDLVLATAGLVVLSPILAALALLVRLHMGAPVLFRQVRPGLRGEPFTMFKFRTMTNARDNDGNLLPDQLRLTRLGRFLRGASLDELPELLNVLSGDMSLVGPRPLLMQYLDRYTPEQARRHDVKPGITGWAQINGCNALTWEKEI